MSTTNATTKAIIDFLNFRGHWAWRVNTQGVFDPRTKRFRKIPKESRGIGDVVCCLRPGGVHLEVEVKTGKDRQSVDQINHQNKVERSGGIYLIAHDFDHFFPLYQSIIMPRLRKETHA